MNNNELHEAGRATRNVWVVTKAITISTPQGDPLGIVPVGTPVTPLEGTNRNGEFYKVLIPSVKITWVQPDDSGDEYYPLYNAAKEWFECQKSST